MSRTHARRAERVIETAARPIDLAPPVTVYAATMRRGWATSWRAHVIPVSVAGITGTNDHTDERPWRRDAKTRTGVLI